MIGHAEPIEEPLPKISITSWET